MQFLLICCLFLATSSAWVLKPGRKSNTTVEEMLAMQTCRANKPRFDVIFPGTKWCGDGDIADDYEDLGKFVNTDKCCRTHDYCDDNIAGGETEHGLKNEGKYTRSHCDCDMEFYDCLSKTECAVSGIVGTAYFNVLGEDCFDYKHPATCIEYDHIILPRCSKYEFDQTKAKAWQWFDVPRWLFGPDSTVDC